MKIKIDKLLFLLTLFCFSQSAFLPHLVFLLIKYSTILLIIFRYLQRRELKNNKALYIVLGLYSVVATFSSIIAGLPLNTIVSAIFYGLHIISIYLIVIRILKIYGYLCLINLSTKFYLLYLAVNDILLLIINYDFSAQSTAYYLVGNKFIVSYIHCLMIFLLYELFRNTSKNKYSAKRFFSRFLISGYALYSVAICWKVSCTSGVFMCLTGFIITLFPIEWFSFLANRKFTMIFLLGGNFLIFGSASVLTLPSIQNFVVNVLHKPPTFNGRFQIYELVLSKIHESIWFGFGQNNSLVEILLNYGNPQNGILKILFDTGIVGLGLYLLILWFSLTKDSSKTCVVIYMFIYTMIAESFIEINLHCGWLFFALAVIFACQSVRNTE